MDLVAQEVIVHLPATERVELPATNLVEVDEGHALHGSDIGRPLRLGLAHDLARLLVVGIAGRQRHQDGVSPLRTNLTDILAQVGAVRIDGVLLLRALVETYITGIRIYAGNHGTGTLLVKELTIVVMTYRHDDPVAWLQGLTDSRPQVCIECAGTHAAQGLIFHRNLVCIEIFWKEIAPAPLAVVAISKCTITHRGVSDKKHHGLRALTRRARLWSRHQCLSN